MYPVIVLEETDRHDETNFKLVFELPSKEQIAILIPEVHPHSTDERPVKLEGVFGLNFVTDAHYC